MNIQQIQYVIALAQTQHFEKAAEKCFVSQSTLSTMISKLEDELGMQLFDRKKKPVSLTAEGAQLLEQMKRIDKELKGLTELTQMIKGEMRGELSIAVIPTIAPFLLPLFISRFAEKFPDLKMEIREQTTAEIIRLIKSRELDIGIVSTPLNEEELREIHLYDEPFVYFDMLQTEPKQVNSEDINLGNLCLLEEGHCMRSQILELCSIYHKNPGSVLNFKFLAGSIDSLLRFVKSNHASTLLPFSSTLDFTEAEKNKLSYFNEPVPYRSVGIVVHQHFVKNKILDQLTLEIKAQIQPRIPKDIRQGRMLRPV